MMRLLALSVSGWLIAGAALAAGDQRSIDQCVQNTPGISATVGAKAAYCGCLVGKMDDDETRSVTQWAISNPYVADDCARAAGWK